MLMSVPLNISRCTLRNSLKNEKQSYEMQNKLKPEEKSAKSASLMKLSKEKICEATLMCTSNGAVLIVSTMFSRGFPSERLNLKMEIWPKPSSMFCEVLCHLVRATLCFT